MGAYYTKEDITEYISKNCVIPYLFDRTKEKCSNAFLPGSSLWEMLKMNPDRYIYATMRHGIEPDQGLEYNLPVDIIEGIHATDEELIEKRRCWNRTAPIELALPTEIFREVLERRKRYFEIRSKITKGEIHDLNDFITYNLNIRQFAQDAIEQYEGSDFIQALFEAIAGRKYDEKNTKQALTLGITILDPTCGSGAFLFAALNILEPLYEGCIERMYDFVEEDNHHGGKKFRQFRIVIEEIKKHPSLKYYILKSIILNNLYGVDIMKEAVETAKLRLFLKLMAEVDTTDQVEPLPDIDFNIRCGNTLVGFATEEDLKKGLNWRLDGQLQKPFIEEKCDIVARAFNHYKEIQLRQNEDYKAFCNAKLELNIRLKELNHELNKLLHLQSSGTKYEQWLKSHQPFHWFAEFYEIINHNHGFDIVIGNPPYVVFSPANVSYELNGFATLKCLNLYAFCCERSFQLINCNGRFGMIIPNSSISADKLSPLQKLFTARSSWISNFAWRPSKLFEGANMLLAIALVSNSKQKLTYSTSYYRWYNDYRESLFNNLTYYNATSIIINGSIPKIPSEKYIKIFEQLKLHSGNKILNNYFGLRNSKHVLFYFRAVLYWIKILEKEPIFFEDGQAALTGEMKPIFHENESSKYLFISILSSSLFFLHYIIWSSCQVINSRDFNFPFDINRLEKKEQSELISLGKKLQESYEQNSKVITRSYAARGRNFTMEKQYFYIRMSKDLLDEIDSVLSKHYKFDNDQLDFIINYDIKYRMGRELENGEEESLENED